MPRPWPRGPLSPRRVVGTARRPDGRLAFATMRGVLLERYTGRPIVDPDLRDRLRDRDLEHVAEFIEQSRLMPTIVGAERNPPLFMDVNNAYSGDELGLPYRDLIGEGIVGSGDLAVSAGAGNSVNIAAGSAWVLGDTNPALQPNYRVYNDAVVNLGISPDPTNARRVLVGAQITDQGFAGSGRTWALQAIHGTPATSPTLPATPASFLPLANVLVPAAAASSAAYTFTDLRSRAAVGGGQATLAATRRIMAGRVSGAGAIVAGSGYTVNRASTGVYVITLTTAFAAVPVVSLTTDYSGGSATNYWLTNSITAGAFTVQSFNSAAAAVDSPFHWIAMDAG